jgi:excisionase family DNA binding protein
MTDVPTPSDYMTIEDGKIPAVKIGRRWLIPTEAFNAFLKGAPRSQPVVLAGGRTFPAGGGGVPADGVQGSGEASTGE